MDAVVLACLSAVLFGALGVALRFSLRRTPDAEVGALATTIVAFAVCALAAAADAGLGGGASLGGVLPFALAGLIAPGTSQILYVRAVQDAGPSRAAVLVGTAPLISVLIALALLGEPFRLALGAATVLIVVGGIALAGEKVRPDHFKALGAALALASAALFATRDNVVRWAAGDTRVTPLVAASASYVAGMAAMLLYLLAARGPRGLAGRVWSAVPVFLPAGVVFGLSYAFLFEAYYRGRVTVVAPLVATESLWAVLLAALLVGKSELIGRRLVLGAVLIVAGGALIGVSR